MKNIKLIEVPSEIGAGTRGASLGIDAIKIAALDFMSNFFVHFPSEKIETENNLFPVVISGDHSNSGGTIAGIKAAKPKSKLGVIWIDAHADLHTPYTTPSGNMHGMPLSAAIGEDNEESKVHELDEKTKKQWDQLKQFGKIYPKVLPEDVVFISLRDYEKEERFLIEK